MNDADVKRMVVKVNDIHTKVAVIETKVKSIDKHLEVQNNRLNKHASKIQDVELSQENFKVSQKYTMIIVGGLGGLGGSLLTIVIKFLFTGGV